MTKMIRTAFPRRHLPGSGQAADSPATARCAQRDAWGHRSRRVDDDDPDARPQWPDPEPGDGRRDLRPGRRRLGPLAKRGRERNPGRGERVVVRARTSGHRRAGARPRPTASQHDQAAAASAHAHRSPTSAPHNGQRPHAVLRADRDCARSPEPSWPPGDTAVSSRNGKPAPSPPATGTNAAGPAQAAAAVQPGNCPAGTRGSAASAWLRLGHTARILRALATSGGEPSAGIGLPRAT